MPKSKTIKANTQPRKSRKGEVPNLALVSQLPAPLRARATALVLLLEVKSGHSLQYMLDDALGLLPPVDRAFTLELLMGSLRFHIEMTNKVRACLKTPFKKQQQWLESVLILGCYQLFKMQVPARAVIHSMVEIVRVCGFHHLTGVTNGILRHLDRQQQRQLLTQEASAPAHLGQAQIAVVDQPLAIHDYLKTGHWLYTILYQDWKRYFLDIMAHFQQKPSMVLRVNTQKTSKAAFRQRLIAEAVELHDDIDDCLAPQALVLQQTHNVTLLPGYAFGHFSVQDIAAQRAVQVLVKQLKLHQEASLEIQPTLKVLDACAAPGGKTAALLEALPANAMLDAVEIDSVRIQRIHENLARLQWATDSVRMICADLCQPQSLIDEVLETGGYDAILLDVPCTGTGVIGRHPDIVFCRRQADIAALVATQRQLLTRAAALLKPGGLLLYTTCSILKQENTHNIQWYFEHNPTDLCEVRLSESLGISQPFGRQWLPSPDQVGDGFYYALLRKNG